MPSYFCTTCRDKKCDVCQIKLYSPEEAARAMLAGEVLKDKFGNDWFWDSNLRSFICKNKRTGKKEVVWVFSRLFYADCRPAPMGEVVHG